ncbi:hypothetical protein RI129_012262 [Pyrocoelia pectoralis]|uniref:Scavenger receptor class B member 1 n=1 Tax=Pyrocoelia pectoralis TaxID=417401 RepID=A0AAN7ZBW3_9COLE
MGLYKQFFRFNQRRTAYRYGDGASTTFTPLPILVSEQGKIKTNRLIIVVVGLFTLAIGILMSSVPWVDHLILKHLRLSNESLSYYYWQKPGVVRLTKVYIFNVTNPENFLNLGEKPKLNEIGPFVYRENMEKVNIRFHDNGTVSYQHKKILQFVPELSVNKDEKLTVPNIPMLTLSSLSNSLGFIIQKAISFALTMGNYQPFVEVTADELVFGYEDSLVALAHHFYPKSKRPMGKMGLLIKRNGTLEEVHTINTGYTGMDKFGLIEKLNGMDRLPFWADRPCADLAASEGSFFPPRDVTNRTMLISTIRICAEFYPSSTEDRQSNKEYLSICTHHPITSSSPHRRSRGISATVPVQRSAHRKGYKVSVLASSMLQFTYPSPTFTRPTPPYWRELRGWNQSRRSTRTTLKYNRKWEFHSR